jgi:hypothetical protein
MVRVHALFVAIAILSTELPLARPVCRHVSHPSHTEHPWRIRRIPCESSRRGNGAADRVGTSDELSLGAIRSI